MFKKIEDFLKKSVPYIVPALILVVITLLKILYCKIYPFLDFDEIIVVNISKQPLNVFIRSVSSEPHSLGFYLFLRLFKNFDPSITRNIMVVISMILTILAVFFGNIFGIWKKYKLNLGMYLLLAGYAFFTTTSYIKQDTITMPILFMSLVVYIVYKDLEKKWLLNLLLFLTVITMFFGLRPFISLMTIWFYEISLSYKNRLENQSYYRSLLSYLFIILFLFLCYLCFFGFDQIANNKYRMSWSSDTHNGLSDFFISALFPFIFAKRFKDIFIILLVVLVYDGFKKGSIFSNRVNKSIVVLFLLNILVGYLTRGYVRIRYSGFIIILLHLLISPYLYRFRYNLFPVLFTLCFIATILFSGTEFMHLMKGDRDLLLSIESVLENSDSSKKFVLLHGKWIIFPKVFLHNYPKLRGFVVSILPTEDDAIDFDTLQLDKTYDATYWENGGKYIFFEHLYGRFCDGYNNVLIVDTSLVGHIEEDTLEFLNKNCIYSGIEKGVGNNTFMKYKDCRCLNALNIGDYYPDSWWEEER